MEFTIGNRVIEVGGGHELRSIYIHFNKHGYIDSVTFTPREEGEFRVNLRGDEGVMPVGVYEGKR